jgi:hypothetical protein
MAGSSSSPISASRSNPSRSTSINTLVSSSNAVRTLQRVVVSPSSPGPPRRRKR